MEIFLIEFCDSKKNVRPTEAQCGQKAVKSGTDGSEFVYNLFFPDMYRWFEGLLTKIGPNDLFV